MTLGRRARRTCEGLSDVETLLQSVWAELHDTPGSCVPGMVTPSPFPYLPTSSVPTNTVLYSDASEQPLVAAGFSNPDISMKRQWEVIIQGPQRQCGREEEEKRGAENGGQKEGERPLSLFYHFQGQHHKSYICSQHCWLSPSCFTCFQGPHPLAPHSHLKKLETGCLHRLAGPSGSPSRGRAAQKPPPCVWAQGGHKGAQILAKGPTSPQVC